MRTIQLDEETSRDLDRLSSQQQTTPEELIKQLIGSPKKERMRAEVKKHCNDG